VARGNGFADTEESKSDSMKYKFEVVQKFLDLFLLGFPVYRVSRVYKL
jgi:hypothetical protein